MGAAAIASCLLGAVILIVVAGYLRKLTAQILFVRGEATKAKEHLELEKKNLAVMQEKITAANQVLAELS